MHIADTLLLTCFSLWDILVKLARLISELYKSKVDNPKLAISRLDRSNLDSSLLDISKLDISK